MTSKERWKHKKDRKFASEVLGRELKSSEQVHHHTDDTLVVCEDAVYHKLLHQRTDALRACGHVDWRRCVYCGGYDDPDNLYINKRGIANHRKCQAEHRARIGYNVNYNREYQRKYRLRKVKNKQLEVISNFLLDLSRIGGK